MSFKKREKLGVLLGFAAVACFGMTLPMTRLAVTELDPIFISMGRAFVASIVALFIILLRKAPFPRREQILSLVMVGLCISIGFPLFATYAMRYLPASHGAIVIGLLPMATAYSISIMNHEKPSRAFWISSILGAMTVVGYSLIKSGGGLHIADILLLLAVVVGALGYAHGAVAAKKMGGVMVMCWGLVFSLPILSIGAIPQFIRIDPTQISWPIWLAFIYLSLVSQLFGMALWYKALSLGSISRVSQVQLMQPFFTIVFAGFFFGEHIDVLTWAAALIVLLSIQFSRKSKVDLR